MGMVSVGCSVRQWHRTENVRCYSSPSIPSHVAHTSPQILSRLPIISTHRALLRRTGLTCVTCWRAG